MQLLKIDQSNLKRAKFTVETFFFQNNRFVCDKCHILPLLEWLDSSLQYWGACFPRSNPLCLKCAMPNQYLNMPIEELQKDSIPDCLATSSDQLSFEETGGGLIEGYDGSLGGNDMRNQQNSSWLFSPYFAMVLALAAFTICGFAIYAR